MALTSDGYQNNVFNLINLFFTYALNQSISCTSFSFVSTHTVLTSSRPQYSRTYGNTVFTSDVSARIGNALLVGAIIGQLSFGLIADRLGRKVGLLLTTILIVIGTILCAAAYGAGGSVQGLFWALTVYRGITGVGM